MEEQIQIYLLSGIFGGVCLILLICVVALFCMVRKLKNGTASNNKRRAGGRDNDSYAYNNPTLQPDEELSRRGFVMHDIGKLPRVQNDAIQQQQQQQQHRPSEFKNNYREYSANQQDRKISTKALPNDFTDILNNDDIVFGGSGNQPSKSQPKTSLIQQQSDRYNSPASSSAAPRLSQFNNNILYGNTNLNNNTNNNNNNNQYSSTQQQSADDKPYYNNNRAINNMY